MKKNPFAVGGGRGGTNTKKNESLGGTKTVVQGRQKKKTGHALPELKIRGGTERRGPYEKASRRPGWGKKGNRAEIGITKEGGSKKPA